LQRPSPSLCPAPVVPAAEHELARVILFFNNGVPCDEATGRPMSVQVRSCEMGGRR
jgi:hypothetical protein